MLIFTKKSNKNCLIELKAKLYINDTFYVLDILIFLVTTEIAQLGERQTDDQLGRVVRKPVNANPGLKVNRSIDFSCIKLFFASYVLFSLRLFKLKREGQTI